MFNVTILRALTFSSAAIIYSALFFFVSCLPTENIWGFLTNKNPTNKDTNKTTEKPKRNQKKQHKQTKHLIPKSISVTES